MNEVTMRSPLTCLVLVILMTSTSQIHGQSQQTRPTGLPTDRNVVAFSNRAEGAMLAGLRDATPVAEAYFQRFVPAEELGYVLDSDRYILSKFKWSEDPTMENLLNYQGIAGGSDVGKSASDQQLLNGLLQIMVPDWKRLEP